MNKSHCPPSVWRNPIHFLAFGFGSGAIPFAPGTFGTLVAIPIYLLMWKLELWLYITIVILLFTVGVGICHKTSRDIGVHDHSGIVWDEIVGFLIVMIAVPRYWLWIVVGFLLFRLFDIWKPWPIKWLDKKVTGGFGVMIDDVLAGVYAWIVLQVIIYYRLI